MMQSLTENPLMKNYNPNTIIIQDTIRNPSGKSTLTRGLAYMFHPKKVNEQTGNSFICSQIPPITKVIIIEECTSINQIKSIHSEIKEAIHNNRINPLRIIFVTQQSIV